MVLPLVLVPVAAEEGLLHPGTHLRRQLPIADHRLEDEVGDLVQAARLHVEDDGAVEEAAAQLKERMEGDGADVRLRPPVAALLDVLLELDPSGGEEREKMEK